MVLLFGSFFTVTAGCLATLVWLGDEPYNQAPLTQEEIHGRLFPRWEKCRRWWHTGERVGAVNVPTAEPKVRPLVNGRFPLVTEEDEKDIRNQPMAVMSATINDPVTGQAIELQQLVKRLDRYVLLATGSFS